VRDSIEAFGGDPGNVTVFGESAGGMSVGTLLALPAAQGLFHRAIPQSGAGHNATSAEKAAGIAAAVLDELGTGRHSVAELQSVPAEQLLAAQDAVSARMMAAGDGLPFQPVVDGEVLPQRPIDAIAAGSADDVTVLTGTNLDEMRLFTMFDPALANLEEARLVARATTLFGSEERGRAALDVYRESRPGATPLELWSAVESDHVFRIPAIRLAEALAGRGRPSFMYLFTWPTPVFGGQLRSCHALEIPFVFGNLDAAGVPMFTGPATDEVRDLSVSMHEAWGAFARDGKPGTDEAPSWPAYDGDARPTMVFGTPAPEVVDDPAGDERRLWEGLL
jgi:para-nitrobenzyl esterase